MLQRRSTYLLINFLTQSLASGCGTVVGNPKKPAGDEPSPSAIVQIPEIDFEIPSEAIGESLNLTNGFLQDEVVIGGQRTVLEQWGKRTRKLVNEINVTTKRINLILEKVEPDADGEYLFSDRGPENLLSGKILRVGDSFVSTLCYDGDPFLTLRWLEGGAIELSRDFAKKSVDGATQLNIVSHVRFEASDLPTLVIESQGLQGEATDFEGRGFNEYAEARIVDNVLELKVVSDWYDVQPEDAEFEGDAYLTGRLYRDGENGGDRRGQAEFVAYNGQRALICRNGFDESRDDLWAPPPLQTPRWCLGRPLGKPAFDDFEDFLATVARLEPVGIVSKTQLRRLQVDSSEVCAKE